MVMNRLPAPSAESAVMLPLISAGNCGPTANFAQSAGSNFNPSGSFCAASILGSMPVIGTSVTVNSGPNDDFTSATFAMLAVC